MKATGYLTIEPTWRGNKLAGATIARLTKTRPRGGVPGAAVVHLTIDIPDRVFIPFEAEALVTAQEGEVGQVKVVIEPFQDDEELGG